MINVYGIKQIGAGDEFDKLRVPVGGDQLTRVRLDGAKCLRLGSPSARESFDNLFPVVIEMFHTQMDFLEKTFKKFMNTASRRKEGTLSNFKVILARTSVNGNVKSRCKAHEDFLMLAGEAYITHAALNHFGMVNLTDQPTKNCPPSDIGKIHYQKRLTIFNEIMDDFLKKISSPFSFEEVPSGNSVVLEVGGCAFNCPVENESVTLQLDVHERKYLVTIPVKTLQEKGHITVSPVTDISVDIKLVKPDDLYNYVLNFLQHFLILLDFKDSVKEGDIFRVNNMLKLMVPYFYNHSPLSKYMVEWLDFILKTEMLLPKKLAIQVRVSSFVNPKGKKGKTKAADMQKENQVKTLKDHVKGLGAKDSIIKVSKAAPVIERIVNNVDRQIHEKTVSTTHKHRSREEDLQCIVQVLNDIKPFEALSGAVLPGFPNIKSSVFEELISSKNGLAEKVMEIIIRLKRGIVQE